MAFLPYKNDGSIRPQSIEWLPAAAITPKVGMALYWNGGNLALCSGTNKPEYISLVERGAALTAGDLIPVLHVTSEWVFAVQLQGTDSSTVPGATVGIHTDGLRVTKYNANGKAKLVDMPDGTGTSASAGDIVYVRFE